MHSTRCPGPSLRLIQATCCLLVVVAPKTQQAWCLVRDQHGIVTRDQLLALGFSAEAIRHRVAIGRLHRVHRGIYAVGRPQLGCEGIWMAAVLSCGPRAALSHASAGALWGIAAEVDAVEVSAPLSARRRQGMIVHRRAALDVTRRQGIPLTTTVTTLVDLAARLPIDQLERAVNEADRLDLIDPEELRAALDRLSGRKGAGILRRTSTGARSRSRTPSSSGASCRSPGRPDCRGPSPNAS